MGHHSASVCAILLRLDPSVSRELLVTALMHDVAEVYTGDIPYPFKRDNDRARDYIVEAEEEWMNEHDIPDPEISPEEYQLLRLADMVDLVLSSLEEVGKGNVYAKQLVVNGEIFLKTMDIWPKYEEAVTHMIYEVREQWVPKQMTTK